MATRTTRDFSWRGYSPAFLPRVPSWVETLGRFGHVAKGVVYFIIGLMAFKLAIGAGGQAAGAREAIREIGQQPFGRFLLGLVAIGLLGYTGWRWVQAVKDTEGEGSDGKGLFKRLAYGISGLIYLLLGCFAGSLALGWGSLGGGGGGSKTSFLLDSPGGRLALAVIGLIVVGAGVYFVITGYKAKFTTKYDLAAMSNRFRQLAFHAGRTGLITRGIAVVIIGGFLINSAWTGAQNGRSAGMGEALSTIAAQPYGKILIGVSGFGLMAYAVHMVLLGWYRRFNVSNA
jgi:hypothetical protein